MLQVTHNIMLCSCCYSLCVNNFNQHQALDGILHCRYGIKQQVTTLQLLPGLVLEKFENGANTLNATECHYYNELNLLVFVRKFPSHYAYRVRNKKLRIRTTPTDKISTGGQNQRGFQKNGC